MIETDGCGNMKTVESIFGSGGFNIPLFELVDEDNKEDIAKRIGANPNDPVDLATHHVFVSTKDLEDESKDSRCACGHDPHRCCECA